MAVRERRVNGLRDKLFSLSLSLSLSLLETVTSDFYATAGVGRIRVSRRNHKINFNTDRFK